MKKKSKRKPWANLPGEEWALVEGTEDYYVSNMGRFRRGDSIRKISIDSEGYCRVNIEKNKYRLHRLVAQAFCPNPNNYPIVDHLNNNRQDNKAVNLEWVDNRENLRRAAKMGLLSECEVKITLAIDKEDNAYLFDTQADCAKQLGLAATSVYKTSAGKQPTVGGYRVMKLMSFDDRRKKGGEKNE